MVLQVDDPGHGHLHAAEHRHHLQLLVVEGRGAEVLGTRTKPLTSKPRGSGAAASHGATHVILLGAAPEVDPTGVAGDVEDGQALQARQGHGDAVALRGDGGRVRSKPALISCDSASLLYLQLDPLLQVLVGLLNQLFGPQDSVPHHVLGATAAGRQVEASVLPQPPTWLKPG